MWNTSVIPLAWTTAWRRPDIDSAPCSGGELLTWERGCRPPAPGPVVSNSGALPDCLELLTQRNDADHNSLTVNKGPQQKHGPSQWSLTTSMLKGYSSCQRYVPRFPTEGLRFEVCLWLVSCSGPWSLCSLVIFGLLLGSEHSLSSWKAPYVLLQSADSGIWHLGLFACLCLLGRWGGGVAKQVRKT